MQNPCSIRFYIVFCLPLFIDKRPYRKPRFYFLARFRFLPLCLLQQRPVIIPCFFHVTDHGGGAACRPRRDELPQIPQNIIKEVYDPFAERAIPLDELAEPRLAPQQILAHLRDRFRFRQRPHVRFGPRCIGVLFQLFLHERVPAIPSRCVRLLLQELYKFAVLLARVILDIMCKLVRQRGDRVLRIQREMYCVCGRVVHAIGGQRVVCFHVRHAQHFDRLRKLQCVPLRI